MPIRPDGTIRCSSCGRTQDQVRKMIAGAGSNNAYICDECIELCPEVLEEELKGQEDAPSPSLVDIHLLKLKKVKSSLDKYVIGQDEIKEMLSVAICNRYKRVTSYQNMDVDMQKSNILMVGPTGFGETYLAQILVKILSVPFVIADATALVEAGYTGEDVENILLRLIQSADHDTPRTEYGITYIDEIDKVTKRSENVSIIRDISGEGVQQTLLKILEGTIASVPPQGGRKHPRQELLQIDIISILFIYGGAFGGLERIVEQHLSAGSISFNAEVANKNDTNINDLLRKVEPKGLTEFGLTPGFIGRVPVMVSLQQLTKNAVVRILSEPKNALMRQYWKLFKLDNVKLGFIRKALEEITWPTVDRKIGARGLHSILESVMMDLAYEIPSDDTIGICTTTRETAKKTGQPGFMYHDMPPASARKLLSGRMRGDNKTGEIV